MQNQEQWQEYIKLVKPISPFSEQAAIVTPSDQGVFSIDETEESEQSNTDNGFEDIEIAPIEGRLEPHFDDAEQIELRGDTTIEKSDIDESEQSPPYAHKVPVKEAQQSEPVSTPATFERAPTTPADNDEKKRVVEEARTTEPADEVAQLKAELEGFRRRAREDIARTQKFAIESFAEMLVPVKDSLEMALTVEAPTLQSIKEGVELTLKQLNSAFEKNKLTEISPLPGDKLDPMKHQAVSAVCVDQNPNAIIHVLQKGYMIADRLLRPALVTVGRLDQDKSQ